MSNSLHVKVNKNSSGYLVFENGEYIFNYSSDVKKDFISLTMPVRSKNYVHNTLHPIFEMHLPEGYLLSIIKKHFSKMLKTDDYGLLRLMSPSIKGRLTYESRHLDTSSNLTLDELLHPKSETLFLELVQRFSLRSALSGVQPKVLVKVEDRLTLKLDEYIVKSWGDDYKELALNEYYCMEVAKRSGLCVPEFYLSDDEKLFIMKRFDILDDKVLGFEDMCVLQARQRDDKYNGSYEQIAKSIKIFVSHHHKKQALIDYFKMIVINNLLKNGDAHLKNFGLIYESIDEIRLAPAYDIVCTTVYIHNDVPALHLLGSKKWWDKKYLIRFGIETCNLTNKEAENAYNISLLALKNVKNEINIRIKGELNKDKLEVLERIYTVMSYHI